ncbi:MAG TPA: PQQ-dependent sugar dehydrogenase [Candidatus Paceibacterota bacterium]
MKNIFALAVAVVAVSGFLVWRSGNPRPVMDSRIETPAAINNNTQSSATSTPVDTKNPQIIASNLDTPWNIVFMPSGDMMVTERPGTLRVIGKKPVSIKVEGVVEKGEGGLLGLALDPDFSSNSLLYLYFTTVKGSNVINRVVRYVYSETWLADPVILIDDIPGGSNHNGGRLAFGPDKLLYITTGEAGNEDIAQDINSLGGKILRIKDDGSIPFDNPFVAKGGRAAKVYSYGHRNPQGLAWDSNGNLWATEHGRSGVTSGFDEVNLVVKGANYGWPTIQGSESKEGMSTPAVHSGATTTWAPSGIAYLDGSLYFAGFRGQALYKVSVSSGKLGVPKEYFKNQYGRLRAVSAGPDGLLYISTSNRDGRGSVKTGDDKVIAVDPMTLR